MLDDLVIPVGSLSISLVVGLSITLKSYSEVARVAVGHRSSMVRVPAAKAGGLCTIPGGGMNDLWCSSIIWLLLTRI